MNAHRLLLAVVPFVFAACGEQTLYKARAFEREGAFIQAIATYEEFLRDQKDHPRRAEILFTVASLYVDKLGQCLKAKPYFEHVVRAHPDNTAISARARAEIFACPNYFPLDSGLRWTYFDSENQGRAAVRVLDSSRNNKTGRSTIRDRFHTPDGALQRDFRRDYQRTGFYLQEIAFSESGKPISPAITLRYPYRKGMSWDVRREGRRYEYTFDSLRETVDVRAGRFDNCLKLRKTDMENDSRSYEYLCPDVGLVLKTLVDEEGNENRDEELVLFSRNDRRLAPATPELRLCRRFFNLKPGAEWTYIDPNVSPPDPQDPEDPLGEGDGIPSEERTVRLDAVTGEPVVIDRILDAEGTLQEVAWRFLHDDGDRLLQTEVFSGGTFEKPETVLKGPCGEGLSWETDRGRDRVRYTIEKKGVRVRTKAGVFGQCLKLREEVEGSDLMRLHYFAPNVGLVLTSVKKDGVARRRKELSAYFDPSQEEEIPEELSFDATGAASVPEGNDG